MTNAKELLPCPFCGGEARHYAPGPTDHHIECRSCSADVSGYMEEAVAAEAWNTRTASGDDFSRAVHDGHLWRRINDHIKCRNCGLNIESVIPLDGCNRNAIRYCPGCGAKAVEHG